MRRRACVSADHYLAELTERGLKARAAEARAVGERVLFSTLLANCTLTVIVEGFGNAPLVD